MTELPAFSPNEYMYETHADKGDEKWEIFAWAIRDLLAKRGGFGKTDIPWKLKNEVFNYYMGKVDTLVMGNGETVTYRPDGRYDENDYKQKKEQ